MPGQLSRQIAFGRRIPPPQIVRRLWLWFRRQAERRLRPSLTVTGLKRAASVPSPLFGEAAATAGHHGGGWTFRFLGRELTMPERVDWTVPGPGARDQLWRMNLHYMEYLAALDDGAFCDLVRQWIAANPPYAPGSTLDGWNAYALSVRVTIWMQQIAQRVERLPQPFVSAVEASIAQQLVYLERHLETDIGGNHIIKNIKALAWAGAYFTGGRATSWRRRALGLLADELDRQILPDGLHFERSLSYHGQVFADLLETRDALGANPLAEKLDARLALMARALIDLTHPDGLPPLFNDAGLAMSHSPAACLEAWNVAPRPLPPPQPVFAYPDGGYYGVRSPDYYLIVDMGRIGPPELPAHAHGDIGSFELSVGGERLVVDQGVFEYAAGEKRRVSRSAASHNVLHIEGGDQAEFFGAFRCGRMPNVEALFEPMPERGGFRLWGRHDGYTDLRGAPLVERTVIARRDCIMFEDRIAGRHSGAASIGLLLHPEAGIETAPEGLIVGRGAAGFVLVSDLEAIIEDDVYWPDMGVEVATRRIRLMLQTPRHEARWQLRLFWNKTQS